MEKAFSIWELIQYRERLIIRKQELSDSIIRSVKQGNRERILLDATQLAEIEKEIRAFDRTEVKADSSLI